jgi:hypothetical protein
VKKKGNDHVKNYFDELIIQLYGMKYLVNVDSRKLSHHTEMYMALSI